MEHHDKDYHYAGFGIRFAAFTLDSLLVGLLILPILIHYYGWQYILPVDQVLALISKPSSFSFFRGSLDVMLSYVFPSIAFIIFWIYRSATPGKMILHLSIIDMKTGLAPHPIQCIIRYFSYYLSLLPFALGFIWIEIDKKNQGWHDKLAKTYVIHLQKTSQHV